ncbi:MAG: hypothetical protein ABL995_02280 [Bryobacteraceae bacterium]
MSYAWATNLLYQMTGTQPPPQTRKRAEHAGDLEIGFAGLNPCGLGRATGARLDEHRLVLLTTDERGRVSQSTQEMEARRRSDPRSR